MNTVVVSISLITCSLLACLAEFRLSFVNDALKVIVQLYN